jgi:hypothetical protein
MQGDNYHEIGRARGGTEVQKLTIRASRTEPAKCQDPRHLLGDCCLIGIKDTAYFLRLLTYPLSLALPFYNAKPIDDATLM